MKSDRPEITRVSLHGGVCTQVRPASRLFPFWGTDYVLVYNRLAVTLFLALEI